MQTIERETNGVIIDVGSLTVDQALELFEKLRDKLKLPATRVYRPRHDYSSWDWTKKNKELAEEHGASYITVCNQRRKLGMPRVSGGKHYPACLSWDWSKSDTAIAREHKINVSSVSDWRARLGKPTAPRDVEPSPYGGLDCGVRETLDFSGVDWSLPDVEIAKTMHCTREYVRQKRAALGIPKSLFHEKQFSDFRDTFKDRKELCLKDARVKFPKLAQTTFNRYCARAGIISVRSGGRPCELPWHLIDFRLPNNLLEEIWHLRRNGAATHRCDHKFKCCPPAFRAVKGKYPPEFEPLVVEQRAKAKEWFSNNPKKED